MTTEEVQRRLAAILVADVVGYSRLMRTDEEGTLSALKAHRRELIDPKIAEHHGRVVKTTGDGMLAEFPSVVDAVRNALDTQQGIAARNAGVPEDRRIEFRVGINLGDVIVEGDDIYGDGVNIAARMEELADPGGICMSASVHEQVRHKLDLDFEDMGALEVKNIAEPVRAWRVRIGGGQGPGGPRAEGDRGRLALPDKPSLAVLPFDNLSGDAEQEYFADGMTEDIITLLSRSPGFFVIARNSSFTYKGQAADVRRVARELGVRYVLEGSVRAVARRIRVTAQLIDAVTGNHIWAERYDREMSDIFAVQDEVAQGIVGALAPYLLEAEAEHARRQPPANVDAWGLAIRAWVKYHSWTADDMAEALALARRAVAVEPDYAFAHGVLALALSYSSYALWTEDWYRDAVESVAEADRAVALDNDDPLVLHAAGATFWHLGQFKKASRFLERAVELDPNMASACAVGGGLLGILDRPDDGLRLVERAIRLSPRDPAMHVLLVHLGFCHFFAGRYAEGTVVAEHMIRTKPDYPEAYLHLGAALSEQGRGEEARAAIDKARKLNPKLSLEIYRRPRTEGNRWGDYVAALKKAGLPERAPAPA